MSSLNRTHWLFRSPAVVVIGLILALIVAWPRPQPLPPANPGCSQGSQVVQVTVLYSGEVSRYLAEAMTRFNKAYAAGLDPLTGTALAAHDPRIYVTGKDKSA